MRSGWTYGSGVEASLGGNWTGKIEYLYLNLDDKNDLFAIGGVSQALNTQIRENIFRAGLNYRLNGNGMYAAMPAANWSGLYVGGNFGGATVRNRTSLAPPGDPGK
jgi:outer membrane immunogenic protein